MKQTKAKTDTALDIAIDISRGYCDDWQRALAERDAALAALAERDAALAALAELRAGLEQQRLPSPDD